jgi:hypothetical protein
MKCKVCGFKPTMDNVVEHFLQDSTHRFFLSEFAFLASINKDLGYIQFLVKDELK